MTLRAIETNSVNRSFSLRRVNHLANTARPLTRRARAQQFGDVGLSSGGIDFLIGIGEIHAIVVLQRRKQRNSPQRGFH